MLQPSSFLWMPTKELLKRLHPENPQLHSEEKDLPRIRHSLLFFGWLQFCTLQEDGNLLSGHGRVMSADHLSKLDQDFFDTQWKKWLNLSEDRKQIADRHQERFCPDYWKQCPVIPTLLDDHSQKAALIRLNDTQSDGTSDPARIAGLLGQMKKGEQELAGWDASVAKNFISAYALKKSQQIEEANDESWSDWSEDSEQQESDEENYGESYTEYENDTESDEGDETEYQDKQYFERPDATDYSGYSEPLSVDEIEIAEVDVSNINDEVLANNSCASYNPDVSEQTRILFYYNKPELPEVKHQIALAAEKLGIDRKGDIKQWRSRAVIMAIKNYVGDFVSQDEFKEVEQEEEE